ncbi:hypothetical protein [Vibrio crassostreae]|uniref:hypothetical protein n=1 Tax=Vibrio crassostreae TaxID=246167 RepID=UPI001B30512A|nr:hypothetical protein [Vibrio crassostreae]
MKKYLFLSALLLCTSLFYLMRTSEDPAAKTEVMEAIESIERYNERLTSIGDAHNHLVEALDPEGETIAHWKRSLEYCKSSSSMECEKLTEAMEELSLTISMRAQRILASGK